MCEFRLVRNSVVSEANVMSSSSKTCTSTVTMWKKTNQKKLKAEFLLGVPLFFITKNSIFRRAALNHLANIFHGLFKFFLKFMLESFCVDFFK